MRHIQTLTLLLLIVTVSCNSTKDLSKYDLSTKENRNWKKFESEALDLVLRHPDDIRVSDSENINDAITFTSDRGKMDRVKFKMIIKKLDNPSDDLLLIGQNMENGASTQFNYNRKTSGLTNYGGQSAYHHEYTIAPFINGETTRYYSLIYDINGARHLVTFEASAYYFFKGKKKMHKILRSIR